MIIVNDVFGNFDFIQKNEDNPFWDLDTGDFPIRIYDRPGLALSNVILRGNVDAATRAIFTPQSLTPAEMKSFSNYLLKGKNPNPLLKTLVDISTNPVFIIGALLAIKAPLGGPSALMKIGRGLFPKAPSIIASFAHGAMHNLRAVPGGWKALKGLTKDVGNFILEESINLDKAIGVGLRYSKDEQLLMGASLDGLGAPILRQMVKGKSVVTGGNRAVVILNSLAKKAGLPGFGEGPLWSGMQGGMNPKVIGATQRFRNWTEAVWKKIYPSKEAFERMKAEALMKGTEVGEYRQNYFMHYTRLNRLESAAMKGFLGTKKGYGEKIRTLTGYVSPSLRKVTGFSMPRLDELERLEQLGMPPVVEKIRAILTANRGRMETLISGHWKRVQGIVNPDKRAISFARGVLDELKKKGVNISTRLGNKILADGSLATVAGELSRVSGTPALGKKIQDVAALLAEPAQYSLQAIPAFRRYITTTATSYGWHILGHGKKIVEIGNRIPSVGRDAWVKAHFQNELIPFVRGFKGWKAFRRNVIFGQHKDNLLQWLQTHPLPQKLLPQGTQKWLAKYYTSFEHLTSESLGAEIGLGFYLSTLGLNLSPVSKNLMQNFITTLHTPGVKGIGMKRGLQELVPKLYNYFNLRFVEKVGADKAYQVAFKDYVTTMGKSGGITSAMLAGDVAKETMILPPLGVSVWEKIKSMMMTPFAGSESFNRLLAFYSGKQGYLATSIAARPAGMALKVWEKKRMAEALEFASIVTPATQFIGGPLGLPKALLGMWPPARQFMHFPLRYASFLGGSLALGEGVGKFTTVGRVAAGSTAAYIAAKNLLGADISQGLLWGALPLPQYEQAAFFPFPLVPPIVGVVGAGVSSLVKGEAAEAKRAAAMLVPSGLALRRLYKTLGPKYADYKGRTPDGRIPVYNDKYALIGVYTPWQLAMRAIGISPTSQQAEYGAAKWLLMQREKVRAYRREYLEALSENDIDRAVRVNDEFQQAYPELGPLQLKKRDITAVQNRREISRLNRILKGFPKAYQPLFANIVSQATLARMTENIEARPTGLEAFLPSQSPLQ